MNLLFIVSNYHCAFFRHLWKQRECDSFLVFLQKADTVIERLANSYCWCGKQGSVLGHFTVSLLFSRDPHPGVRQFFVAPCLPWTEC